MANMDRLGDTPAAMLKEGKAGVPEFAELKRRFGWEFNGIRLHELYFGSMAKEGPELDKTRRWRPTAEGFGSYENGEGQNHRSDAPAGCAVLRPCCQAVFNAWVNDHDAGHLAGGSTAGNER